MTPVFDREYSTVDKTSWGPGPWQDEPDKAQWVDEATGLDCLIVRGPAGALCGYVGVAAGHPWFEVAYEDSVSNPDSDETWPADSPESIVDVHGGLTFSRHCQQGDDESVGICHVPLPGRSDEVWWFGFDCAHSGDVMPSHRMNLPRALFEGLAEHGEYRTLDYVVGEVARLAEQIAAAA